MEFFDTALADPKRWQLEKRITGQLTLGNDTHISQQMGRGLAEWVAPGLTHLDQYAGQVRGVNLDFSHLPPIKIVPNRHRHEASITPNFPTHPFPIMVVEGDHAGNACQSFVNIGAALRDDDELIILLIGGDLDPVTVADDAPQRRQQSHVDAVVLGQHFIAVGLDHLQVIHPRRQA